METLISVIIGALLSGFVLLIKVTIWATLGWFWVLLPLMLFTGIFIFSTDADFF